jgi:hypothetical protein
VFGRRHLAIVVLLFVAVDFSSPMARGAFEFDPDDSLDCAWTAVRVEQAPVSVTAARWEQPRVLAHVVRLPPAPVVNYRADVTRDRLIAPSAPPSSTDDH